MDSVQWKPIDSFPHPTEPYADGIDNWVLLATESHIAVGYALYDYDDDGIPSLQMWTSGGCQEFEPTHWDYLPELPKASKSER